MVRPTKGTRPMEGAEMSARELQSLPDVGLRYELIQGVLRVMSPAGGRHGRIALRLARRLGDYVERHDLGETYAAETGFLIERDPDTVRAPDVAFVARDRLADWRDYAGYLPLAPDLVAEVVSPSDRSGELEEKVASWLAAGVCIVLVVDPQAKSIRVWRSPDECDSYTEGDVDLGPVLEGCRLDVSDVLA
jgi:Uma2 family endonuclease